MICFTKKTNPIKLPYGEVSIFAYAFMGHGERSEGTHTRLFTWLDEEKMRRVGRRKLVAMREAWEEEGQIII